MTSERDPEKLRALLTNRQMPDNSTFRDLTLGELRAAFGGVRLGSGSESLDAAWAKAEAALPEGWFLQGLKRGYVGARALPNGPRWSASAIQGGIGNEVRVHGTVPSKSGQGPTPAAALLALADRLTGATEP